MSGTSLPEYHPFRSAEARERYLAHYDERSDAWPLDSEVLMVETDAGVTRVRIHGREDAPPLVLLNGAWCNSLAWSPKMVGAFAARFRTYTLDNLYDFGRSVPVRPGGGAADHNAWLDGLFDALGLTSGVNLFGISRGAWIAAEYVLHAPERLGKVVWLSPALVVGKPSLDNARHPFNSISVLVRPNSRNVAKMMRDLMPEMEQHDKAYFERFVDDMVIGLQCFKGIKGASLGPRVFTDAELASIDTPVLFLVGETESMFSAPAALRRLAAVAPRIEAAVLPGGGHDIIDLQQDALMQRTFAFLES